MALVASVDYPNKRIYLSALTAGANLDTLAVYREVRALRRTNAAHRSFRPMIVAGGNIPKISGLTYTPAYVQLLYGCRIVPYNGSHTLRLVRDTFTDDGMAGRDCFDRTPLSPAVEVNIDVDFPEVEIRTVDVNGVTGPSASDIAAAILALAQLTPIHSDVRKVNGDTIIGHGIPPTYDNTGTMTTPGDPWRPA